MRNSSTGPRFMAPPLGKGRTKPVRRRELPSYAERLLDRRIGPRFLADLRVRLPAELRTRKQTRDRAVAEDRIRSATKRSPTLLPGFDLWTSRCRRHRELRLRLVMGPRFRRPTRT